MPLFIHYPPRRNVEKRNFLDHLDAAFLIVDELIDRGYV